MRIAILGAECTGKTQLAQTLAAQLRQEHPDSCWIPEALRDWCDAHGRTPQAHEQAAIAQAQMARVLAAPVDAMVLSDTTPLMTAVYSDVLFGDPSLYDDALAQQRHFDLTLLTAPDLPWVADGLQRDGVAMRQRVDGRLREVLQQQGIAYSSVFGAGEARSRNALQVIHCALGTLRGEIGRSNWQWSCEKCSDPQCEHRLFRDLVRSTPLESP